LVAGPHLSIYLRPLTNPLILEFLIGAWIAIAFRAGLVVKPSVAWLLIVTGLCLVYFSSSKGEQNLMRISTWGFGFAFVVAAVALRERSHRISPHSILVQIGEASYSMYLTHWFVVMTPPAIIIAFVPPAQHPIAYSIFITSTVIALALVVHRLFERPLTNFLRRDRYTSITQSGSVTSL
jgi:peptidoglycan/LPS O-acetylase OafA/YrhL